MIDQFYIVIASSTSHCIEGKIRRNCFIIYIVGYFKNIDVIYLVIYLVRLHQVKHLIQPGALQTLVQKEARPLAT